MVVILYMDVYMQCVYAFVCGCVDGCVNVRMDGCVDEYENGFENYIIRYRKSSLIIEL